MGILAINDSSFYGIVKYYIKSLAMIVLSVLLCDCASGKQRLPMFDPAHVVAFILSTASQCLVT